MRANTRLFIFIGSALALTGCGGIGLNTTGTGGTPSTSVRQNQNGDSFTYTVSGSYSQTNGAQNVTTSGNATETFVTNSYAGQTALNDTLSSVITLNGATTTLIDGKQINSTGTILGQTDVGVMQAVASGGFTLPTSLTLGSNVTNAVETLANGTMVTLNYTVTGSQSVSALGTTYACWTISKTLVYSDGLTSALTIEFAPSMGAAVEFTVQNTYTNGLSETLTYTLSAAPTLG